MRYVMIVFAAIALSFILLAGWKKERRIYLCQRLCYQTDGRELDRVVVQGFALSECRCGAKIKLKEPDKHWP